MNYLIQIAFEQIFCLGVLYLFFIILPGRTTHFTFNRVLLIISPVISFIIPFLHFNLNGDSNVIPKFYTTLSHTLQDVTPGMLLTKEWVTHSNTIYIILVLIYVIGVLFFLVRLIFTINYLLRTMIRGKGERVGEYYRIEIEENLPMSSFLNYILWDSGAAGNQNPLILNHEKSHIRQRHSLDVIFFEVMKSLMWFNPFIYILRTKLKETHEYIADRSVINSGSDLVEYSNLLVKQSVAYPTLSLANNFYTIIEKRLKMLSREKSHISSIFFHLLSIPVFSILLISFSFDEKITISPHINPPDIEDMKISTIAYEFRWGSISSQMIKGNNLVSKQQIISNMNQPIEIISHGEKAVLIEGRIAVLRAGKETTFFNVSNHKLDSGAKSLLHAIQSGDTVYFDNLSISTTKTTLHNLPMVVFQIQ